MEAKKRKVVGQENDALKKKNKVQKKKQCIVKLED